MLPEHGRIGVLCKPNELVAVYDGQIDLSNELKRNGLRVETDSSVTVFYVSLSDSTSRFIESIKFKVKIYAVFQVVGGYIIAIPSKERKIAEETIRQVKNSE